MGAIAVPRAVARVLNGRDARPPGFRQRPERIVLPVRPGLAASDKPPVRIFVGTEREQDRAERVFIFSIEQVRDPARVYEIYLMKEIADFDRSRWLTGFTNYRFAIPHWAGASGRAIYNDVDQIYLGDPAEMFDLDMQGHGFLSITARDTSVMLIDCAKMAAIWPLDAVQHERRKRIEERARAVPDLWGPLAREWNARDEEYVAGRSKVLHYTTIHTQPWQPFPYRFVYQHNAVGYVWTDLERAADRAHFQVFNADRPSAQYEARMEALRAEANAGARRATATAEPEGLELLLAAAGAATVLDVRLGLGGEPDAHIAARGRTVTRFDPAVTPFAGLAEQGVDAVVCAAGLPYLPIEDTPWVVASLFRAARRCVYVRVRAGGHDAPIDANALPGTWREPTWWEAQMAAAGARYPDVRWKLVVHHAGAFGRLVTTVREGGRRTDGQPPAVWVLADDKAGHTTQSMGLAEALGWPYEVKKLRFNGLDRLSNRVLGATLISLDRRRSAALAAPWPDLVISTGRRAAPVARWIARQSGGRTRLVHIGRKGGDVADVFDLVISCAHFRKPMHPRRIETVAPIVDVTPERLAAAAAHWRGRFDDAPHPHIALIVGGTSAMHALDEETARRLGAEVRAMAEAAGGSVHAITSPRTGAAATAALEQGLGPAARLHRWRKGEADNPYLAYLALADAIVVTGESESMLAEAAATGKPLYIYPLPDRPRRLRRRIAEWVVERAYARPRKEKGTVRPQQGMEYVCARLIERGLVRPRRDLRQLHENLIARGVAQKFGAPLALRPQPPLREVEEVAGRIRAMLGFPARNDAAADTKQKVAI